MVREMAGDYDGAGIKGADRLMTQRMVAAGALALALGLVLTSGQANAGKRNDTLEFAFQQLRRPAQAAERVLDLMSEIPDQLAVGFGLRKPLRLTFYAQLLLDKAGVEKDSGIVAIDKFAEVGTRRHWAREAKVRDLA